MYRNIFIIGAETRWLKIVVSPVIKAQCNITMMIIAISSEHLHNRSKDQVGSAAARPPGSPQTPPHNASDLLSFTNFFAFLISIVCGYICFCISLAVLRPPRMPRTSCHLLLFSFLVFCPETSLTNPVTMCPLHPPLIFWFMFCFCISSAEVYLI